MCDPISATLGAAVIGGAFSAYSANKSAKAQKAAISSSERQAAEQAQRSEQQFNKLNQKEPGIAALMARNQKAAGRGIGSTFLTGPKGVSPGMLPLGGGSLLGGGA